MKRIQLIAAALCLVMIATVGAGVVAAKPSPSNYKFDVTYNDKVVGQAVVNLKGKTPTYSITIRGLSADTQYIFGYTAAGVAHRLGVITSVPKGAFVQQETFPAADVNDLQSAQFWVMERPVGDGGGGGPIYGFYLDNLGAFVAKIACYYSTDGGATWKESDHKGLDHRQGWASLKSLGVPDKALVKFHCVVVGGKDRTDSWVWNYDYAQTQDHWYAAYYIEGKTWNPTLNYYYMMQITS
jgi:hypothetical protein